MSEACESCQSRVRARIAAKDSADVRRLRAGEVLDVRWVIGLRRRMYV